jgi:predicted NBD/HSP70 family sugar kinase
MTARIGVDLGGTKIEAVLLDPDGSIRFRKRTPTPKNDYAATLAEIKKLVEEVEANSSHQAIRLPVGVGTPGAISHRTGCIKNSNNTCLNGQPLKRDLSRLLGREVVTANDADCFALSEAVDGAGADATVMFGVILGTGVGGGICVNHRLIQGANSITGEWGHNRLSIMEEDLPGGAIVINRCSCGMQNCVETWLSGPSFQRRYQDLTATELTSPEIVSAAEAGDETASNYLEQYCRLLALALANVINLLDPEIIVLGGGMSNIDRLYKRVPAYLGDYVFTDQVETRLVKARFGDSSGVRGAAWLNGG